MMICSYVGNFEVDQYKASGLIQGLFEDSYSDVDIITHNFIKYYLDKSSKIYHEKV